MLYSMDVYKVPCTLTMKCSMSCGTPAVSRTMDLPSSGLSSSTHQFDRRLQGTQFTLKTVNILQYK